jgi:NAD(P)-dependent dehydrogenase (short-subunit alcohol dehydrogenase family)
VSRTWRITGTSSGFGRDLTELVLARGQRVAATLRKPGALDDLKATYGDNLWIGHVDVTDTEAVRRIVHDAFTALGQVDVAVSNAGYGLFGGAEECTDAQIERQIAANLTGSIQFARAVMPYFRSQGRGHFMQVSSMRGQVVFPYLSFYHATKWGIEGFCESLAQEVAAFGIKVTLVEPGSARTLWAGASGYPLERAA